MYGTITGRPYNVVARAVVCSWSNRKSIPEAKVR
jgi:hypothetical protein